MFPAAGSEIYRNEAGEPTGWDSPSYFEPEYPDDDEFFGDDEEDCEDDDK